MTWTTRPRSKRGANTAIVAGDGPRILLLHGVGLRAEAWAPVIDALSADFEVVAPDIPGHGDSTPNNALSTIDDYAETVLPWLEVQSLVVGHSMGAMIALEIAARYPSRVLAVAALNAIFERSPEAQAAVQARAASLDWERVADPAATLTRWFGTSESPEQNACRAWLKSVDPASYKQAYTVFANQDGPTRNTLAELNCPALFMTGAEEPNSTPAMSKAMADLAPNGRAIIVNDAAHMMPMTHVTDTIAALRALAREVMQ